MVSSLSIGKTGVRGSSTTIASTKLGCARPGGSCSGRHRSRRSGTRPADAAERCTRTACLALMVLVFLGERTSGRPPSAAIQSSPSSTPQAGTNIGRIAWRGCRGDRQQWQRRTQHKGVSQLFAQSPNAGVAPTIPARHSTSTLHRSAKATLPSARSQRCRSEVVRAVAGGSTGSAGRGLSPAAAASAPAQLYRVRRPRSQDQGQGQLGGLGQGLSSLEAEAATARDTLRSPRSAIGDDGRDYPESLNAYSISGSTVASMSPVAAEDLGAGAGAEGAIAVGVGEFERPAVPELSEEELTRLRLGQRVQKQTRDGGSGSGSVVMDVRADPDVVLGLLTKYEKYAEMIDTVRQCEVFPQEGPDKRKVEVTVSRFRLHIRVVMSFRRDLNMVRFELDPECTKAGRAVLREATGFFFVESPPDRPGYSRVWLYAEVDVNRFVPGVIVDYAAGRALPRASNWIKPMCEAAQRRKLRELASSKGCA